MNKIKQLSPHEAQRIAAGEVVERPASVVKELVENALDAGSTKISLYIEHAGKSLIRLVDNGCGMSAVDARACFLPHATSKLSSVDDLDTLMTFGFRGEALAAIASVSNITLKTAYQPTAQEVGKGLGVILTLNAGVIESEIESALSYGTDIAIHDLFFNTPVRKKFLKSDETEWNQIEHVIIAAALSNKHVHWTVYKDNKVVINAPPASEIKTRVGQLWGHNSESQMMLVPEFKGKENISVVGVISQHQFYHYGKHRMMFFVNGRAVKNTDLARAVMKGYQNILPPQRYPSCVLFLSLDISAVDVNIHPRKEEVRFARPGIVENIITDVVRKALEMHVSSRLEEVPQHLSKPINPYLALVDNPVRFTEPMYIPEALSFKKAEPLVRVVEELASYNSFDQAPFIEQRIEPDSEAFFEQEEVVEKAPKIGTVIGQMMATYILVEQTEQLIIVDQHAAHERIMYEKFKKSFDAREGIRLLFPETITLAEREVELILQYQNFFLSVGVELERFAPTQLAVYTKPAGAERADVGEVVRDAVSFINEYGSLEKELLRQKLFEHVHSHMACKAALRAGDILSRTHMEELLSVLAITENRYICAHGRPTMWEVGKQELEKKFRRC